MDSDLAILIGDHPRPHHSPYLHALKRDHDLYIPLHHYLQKEYQHDQVKCSAVIQKCSDAFRDVLERNGRREAGNSSFKIKKSSQRRRSVYGDCIVLPATQALLPNLRLELYLLVFKFNKFT